MNSLHRYVFLGPQGSGKGTQATRLADKLGIVHLSTGELFREAVDRESPLGKAIKEAIAAGQMISDDTTNKLVTEEFIRQNLIEKGYVLDGYPRNIDQLKYLEDFAAPTQVVLLELDNEVAVERIAGRIVCTKCETIYHRTYRQPTTAGQCDKCGGKLESRSDDTEEAVRQRLGAYHKQTAPLALTYETKGRLVRIDARPGIDEIHEAIVSALGV